MKNTKIKISILAIFFMVYQTYLAHALTLTPYFGGYRFEGNSNVGDTLLIGLGVDYQLTDNFAADLIYLKGDSDLNYLNIDTQECVTLESIDTNIFHISGRYHLLKNKSVMPYVTTGLGIFYMNTDYAEMFRDHPDRHYLFQFHYGAGIKYSLTDTLTLRGDFRHMISFDNMDNDLSAIFGISYTFGMPAKEKHRPKDPHKKHENIVSPKTKDHTTIKTKHAETDAKHSETHATPESHQKTQAKTETSKQVSLESKETKKEPEPQVTLETKKTTDRMDSHKDHAKLQAESHMDQKSNEELQMAYVDIDADGVLDHIDRCPKTPRNVRVNMFGCGPDHDRDGVIDVLDHCPNTPAKTKVDQNGCRIKAIIIPDKHVQTIPKKAHKFQVPKKTQKFQMVIEFDYKSALIKDIYYVQIAKIKQWIKKLDHPVLIINSHTDNIGSHIYNINLSEKRAESVKNYLHRHFQIPDHLIKLYCFGESQPIADNSTEEGRQKNRRAEIVVTENNH